MLCAIMVYNEHLDGAVGAQDPKTIIVSTYWQAVHSFII